MTAVRFPTVESRGFAPDPVLAERRATEPIFKIQPLYGSEAWLVTRLDDVRAVLTDPRFSRAATLGVDVARTQPHPQREATIIGMDPPHHTRIRRLVSGAMTPRRIEDLRPLTQRLVDQLLDAMVAAGPQADVVADLAFPLPIAVISELLGVPYEDRNRFRGWADTFMSSTGHTVDEIMQAHADLSSYLAELIAIRRATPHNDLLGALVAARDDNGALTEQELVSLGIALLLGGFETTASHIAKSVLCLLGEPDQLQSLRDDPGLVPQAVEELLRFVPIAAGTAIAYIATADVEIRGVTIRAGEAVMASAVAANRDPLAFDHPDELDVTRAHCPHVGLGHGIHFCLGAHLARMELQVAIGSLITRFPDLRLAVDPQDVRWKTGSAVWGLESLPIAW
jgi:cytochrome P450